MAKLCRSSPLWRLVLALVVIVAIIGLASSHRAPSKMPPGHPDVAHRHSHGKGHADSDECPFHKASKAGNVESEEQLFHAQPIYDKDGNLVVSEEPIVGGRMKAVFDVLFPGTPMVNSLLGTTYISLIPNLLLYFVPPDIKPESLNTLVAFAVGGLLGDVFLHLLPHSFMGEVHGGDMVEVSEVKNVAVGLGIFVGFFIFFCIDKVMRVLSGGDSGHGHSHGHAHDHEHETSDKKDKHESQTGADKDSTLRQRKPSKKEDEKVVAEVEKKKEITSSIKLSAYLNLIADATHNFTDGLAMAASFYTSPAIGATTTVAVFFHEIPHEVGDYAILIQSGFPRSKAMMSQFITAIGAFLGTFAGIAIEEMSRAGNTSESGGLESKPALFGFESIPLQASELVIPFTAGGFLYIATVGVIPELLTVSGKFAKDARQFASEIVAMMIGVGMMVVIALNE